MTGVKSRPASTPSAAEKTTSGGRHPPYPTMIAEAIKATGEDSRQAVTAYIMKHYNIQKPNQAKLAIRQALHKVMRPVQPKTDKKESDALEVEKPKFER